MCSSDLCTYLLFVLGDIAMGMLFIALFEKSLLSNQKFLLGGIVAGVLAIAAIVIEGVHFMMIGFSIIPFVVASLFAVASIVAILMVKQSKIDEKTAAYIMVACMIIAVAIARYSFYAASAI